MSHGGDLGLNRVQTPSLIIILHWDTQKEAAHQLFKSLVVTAANYSHLILSSSSRPGLSLHAQYGGKKLHLWYVRNWNCHGSVGKRDRTTSHSLSGTPRLRTWRGFRVSHTLHWRVWRVIPFLFLFSKIKKMKMKVKSISSEAKNCFTH